MNLGHIIMSENKKNGEKNETGPWYKDTEHRCHRKAVSAETSGSVFTLTPLRTVMDFLQKSLCPYQQ